jgi:hypothetical protein
VVEIAWQRVIRFCGLALVQRRRAESSSISGSAAARGDVWAQEHDLAFWPTHLRFLTISMKILDRICQASLHWERLISGKKRPIGFVLPKCPLNCKMGRVTNRNRLSAPVGSSFQLARNQVISVLLA